MATDTATDTATDMATDMAIDISTGPPSVLVPRSCSATLAAPELLCRILLFLPPEDLLLKAPRVCKYWKDAIERDPDLQRALFFKAQPERRSPLPAGQQEFDVELNPFFESFLSPVPTDISCEDKINDSGYKGKADICDLFKNCARSDSWRRPEASWRRMLVQQPPRDLVVIQKRTCEQPYDELRYYMVKQFSGVLMSDLYHLLWAYIHVSMTQGLLEEVAAEFEEDSSPEGILACATRWFLLTRASEECMEARPPQRVDLPAPEQAVVTQLQERFLKEPNRPMVLTLMDRCNDCRGQCRFCGPWMARYGQQSSAEAAIRLGFTECPQGAIAMWDDWALQHGAGGAKGRKREEKMSLRKQGWQTIYKADYADNEFEHYNGALALVDLTR